MENVDQTFLNSLTIGMDKKMESKIMDELKRFDEALDNGEFNLNLQ